MSLGTKGASNVTFTRFVDGVDFGEGPRWHDGRLWYSDFFQQSIYTVSADGERTKVLSDDRPSGMDWLPNGDLVFVSMRNQNLLRWDGTDVHPYADLSSLATGFCNDMIMSADGTAYVGNFGFDLENAETFAPATLIGVRPDGEVFAAAENMAFPNGSVITPDGSTLIVGQSFGGDYVAFDIVAEGGVDDGTLTNRRQWAEIPGTAPDGCTLDAGGGIWFADAVGKQIVRVLEGGEVTHCVETPDMTFACMLGGDDGRTLFVLTSPGGHPDQSAGKGLGAIWAMPVDVPRAGRP